LLSTSAAGAQTRIVTGRVVDSLSSDAVASGQVLVVGTTISTTIKDDGTFTIAVPNRDVTLSVRSIGFRRKEIPVAASVNSVQASLERDFFQLEAIVVTGQATGIERRNLANAVSTVTAEQVVKTATASVDQALQGKLAGAQIMANNGAPGGGMRVQLRGVTSILGEAQPLYVVDGVIMSDASIAPGTTTVTRASGSVQAGMQESPVNRIADLNPNDIENVEVLKGASASAIYGSKASNGVIIITTKRGRVGQPQFNVTQRFGYPELSNRIGYRRFPDSLRLVQAYPTAGPFWKGPNYEAFDHETVMYGNKPLGFETAASVNGGTENTRYFASALVKHEGGIVTNTFADKQSLRLNIDQSAGSRLNFGISTQVVRNENDRGFTGNDNSSTSYGMTVNKTPNVIDLRQRPDGTWPVNPFIASNFVHTAAEAKANEQVWRVLAAGRVQWSIVDNPVHQLKLLGNGGADQFTQKDVIQSPVTLQYEPVDTRVGTYSLSFGQNLNLNLGTNLVHTFKPASAAFTANTSFGVSYETREQNVSRSISENLLAGVMAIQAGTVRTATEDHSRVEDFGFFGQEEFLTLQDKLMVTVGIRADQSSTNSDPSKLWWYPKTAASYRFINFPGPVDELKLRAAFGQSGNQPKYGQKFTNLGSSQIDGLGTFSQGGNIAAVDLHPERQRELEAGFDATLFNSRGNLEVTVYEKTITELLLDRALAPTTGFSQERFNGGTLRTRGLEATLNLIALQSATSSWNTRFTFAKSKSLVTELPVPAFLRSVYQTGAFWIREGESPTALWGNDTATVGDAEAPAGYTGSFNAFLAGTSIALKPHPIGEMTPKFTMAMANDISYKAVKLYVLWDFQNGGMLAAGTWRHNDLSLNAPDHDIVNPITKPLYEAAGRPVRTIGQERVDWYRQVTAAYFKDASYLKLREVQLTFDVPMSAVKKVWGAARFVRVGVSGRNVLQITPYRGGDPEASTFAANATDGLPLARELGAYPPSRSWWLSFDVGF
jgi:TonB-linked SusC/RagA family outer membrane protein